MTYDIENLCSGFGQAQKCGGVKPIIVFVVFWFFFHVSSEWKTVLLTILGVNNDMADIKGKKANVIKQ
jgi:hypothetical protein